MKKILALLLASVMVLGIVAACGNGDPAETPADTPVVDAPPTDDDTAPHADREPETVVMGEGETVLNVWSFTDELGRMIEVFMQTRPDLAERFTINYTEIAMTDQAYATALDMALLNGDVDLFAVEESFALRYTQGEASHFAVPYSALGIADVEGQIIASQIAPYSVDLGRNADGEVVALGFQATGGVFIYRRDIALEVFGTDDPDAIGAEIGPGWARFMDAAQTLADAGYAIVAGHADVYRVVNGGKDSAFIDADGYLHIDPDLYEFIDMARAMYEGGFHNSAPAWQDAWFAAMSGASDPEVFGFFGPAWLINYVMAHNAGDTYGNWAITTPPVGFFWGGTWLIATSTEHAEFFGPLLEWITLDSSEDGMQWHWANGTLFGPGGTKDSVASGVVMAQADGTVDFLGGQDMFDFFIPANAYARSDTLTQFCHPISDEFLDQVEQYAQGLISRDEAIANFRQWVNDMLLIPSR